MAGKVITIVTTQPLDKMTSPSLVEIYDASMEGARNRTTIFSQQEFVSHPRMYPQPDGFNCGPLSVLNVTAAYLAETVYQQNWVNVWTPFEFWQQVMEPYWKLPRGGKGLHKGMAKRLLAFWFNFVALTEKLFPTDAYYIEYNKDALTMSLHLPDGEKIESPEWDWVRNDVTQGIKPENTLFSPSGKS